MSAVEIANGNWVHICSWALRGSTIELHASGVDCKLFYVVDGKTPTERLAGPLPLREAKREGIRIALLRERGPVMP